MIPLLYKKDGITKIGELTNCIECLVEEERNGIFEVSIIYPTTDSIFNSLEEENIIICDANDTLKAQKFRIYMTRKLMSNKIEVYARHISFDLAYDTVDNIDITNQSCEYVLNTIFRQSQFSTHYRGYSDIVNAQNYKMSMANCIEAIAGKEGSIIDTFGTGAEILRDNTNIHVLNKRGHDNEVSIEYAKNLTGFELEEDYSELVTRINAYAKYTNNETNKEVFVEAKGIDSPLITNYSHPYVAYIDYSDQFENEEVPTKEKLIELAKKEYSINNKDKPKQNYKIEFVPLSKCVGYEGLEDKISLCDTVTIKDTRYGIDTKSKVIRTVFDVLKNRYDSMELGEPRTTLGDIIGGSGEDGEVGPPGPQGPPGADGNVGDFPDSLPSVPVLSSKVYGFANIELSWTYENKVYYNYELYASKTKDFTPNVFDIIHQGQTSSFLFQAKPNETWYFRACAVNTHGNRTEFSSQIAVTTKKVDDLSNYVDNMAINDALIGTLSLDRGWVGQLRGNWIDAKQLSVTDGNGKRTLDIDSFGNIVLNPATMEVNSPTGIKILHSNGAYTLLNNKDLRQVNSNGKVTLAMNGWQYKCYDFGNNNNFIGGMTPTGSDSGYWKTSLFSNGDDYPVSIGYVGSNGMLYDYIHCTRKANAQNRVGITLRQNVHMNDNVRMYWNSASKSKHQVSMYAGSNVAADNSITVWGLWNHTLDQLLMRFFTDGSLQLGKHLKMYKGNSIYGRNPNDEEMMMIENPTSGSLYIGPPKTQVSNSSNTGGIGQITNLRGGETRIYAHWSAVYLGSSGSTVVTSDRNLKHDIECLDNRYEEMFKCLKPVTYIYNEHKRKHVGFIAQEVEGAMINAGITSEEFAGLCINKDFTDDPNGDGGTFYEKLYTLRYEEFIALNTQMIQKNMKEISDLKDENAKLKSRLDKIEKMLGITE